MGVAAHHAGLVPVFRETVEECFAAGLLKVVFATETLSLGINMPARSVVIERFTKYGGAGRATLTSGEYLQLTGRAGRRGLDEEGHAVVGGRPRSPSPRRPGSRRPRHRTCARRSGRPTTSPSTWCRGSTAAPPTPCCAAPSPSGRPASRTCCSRQLGHRVAVLEQMGYVDGWALTPRGPSAVPHLPRGRPPDRRGARAATSWPGPSRPCWPACCPRSSSSRAGPGALPGHHGPPAGEAARPLQDRLGDKRTAELAWRCDALDAHGRAHPGHRGGASRPPDPPAGARPGHRGGLVGPGGVLLDGPRRSPPATSASWRRATSCAR